MGLRVFLQRHGIDLALGYVTAAAVLIERAGFFVLGPWAPAGWYGYAELSTGAEPPGARMMAGWSLLLLPYFGPPLVVCLATLIATRGVAKPGTAWSLPRLLLLCAAWITSMARFGTLLGLEWARFGGPGWVLSRELLNWVIPFGPPLLVLGFWAWRQRRGTPSVSAV